MDKDFTLNYFKEEKIVQFEFNHQPLTQTTEISKFKHW